MKYKFYKEEIAGMQTLGIIPEDEKFNVLFRLGSHDWDSNKAQELIDKVTLGKTKKKEEEYVWANEDMTLYANENGVFLVDEISIRYGERDPDRIGLELTHDEFVNFMKDFKKFIIENV